MRRTDPRLISSVDHVRSTRSRVRWRRACIAIALLSSTFASTGCVTIYQPQKAIHRPVVVDRSPSNFAGMKILVRCMSHETDMPAPSASRLCGWVAEEFNRQGAETEIVVPVGAAYVEPEVFEGQRPDLTVVIESRTEHDYTNPWTVFISVITFTAAPTISEMTFSQRVFVLGRDGSVLVEEVYRERFVRYTGLGVWSTNYLLDWFVRPKDEAVSGDVANKDFTKDLHGQIRQLTFNAKVRSEVLGLTQGKRNKRRTLVSTEPPVTLDAEGDEATESAGDDDGNAEGVPGGAAAATPDTPASDDPAEGG